MDENSKVTVTFRDLQAALPDIYGIGWSIIGERLLRNKVAKLASLSSEDKAALLFLQIHGCVFAASCLRAKLTMRIAEWDPSSLPSSLLLVLGLSPVLERSASSLAHRRSGSATLTCEISSLPFRRT